MARIYRLGDFENLTIKDTLLNVESTVELPDNLALDENLLKQLQYLQMVRIESMAYKYYQLRKKFKDCTLEEAIGMLEDINNQLNLGLKEYLTVQVIDNKELAKGA
jgi:hypothetical protein